MIVEGKFIDANLLALILIGSVDRKLISKHKRTRQFTSDQYDYLVKVISPLQNIFVIPNSLTEVANLLTKTKDTRFAEKLAELIQHSIEVVSPSKTAVKNSWYLRLGLTDVALLEVISPQRPLLTVDLKLFNAAMHKDNNCAINLNHQYTNFYDLS